MSFPADCKYTKEHEWRNSSEEMKQKDSLFSEKIESLRKAAEVHRQVRKYAQSIAKPGIKMVDFCKNIEAVYGNLENSQIPKLSESITRKCVDVSYKKEPRIDEAEFDSEGSSIIKYRQIILPFGPDDHTVDHIFGGMRYKIYDH